MSEFEQDLDEMVVLDNAETGAEDTGTEAAATETDNETTDLEESAPLEDEQTTGKPAEEKKKVPEGVQKKINKLTGKVYAETHRANEAEAKLNELQQSQAKTPGVAPKIEDFDYDDDAFNEAVIAHNVNKALDKRDQENQSQKQKTKNDELINDYNERVFKSDIKEADYTESYNNLVEARIPLSVEVQSVIQADERGPYITQYLGNNLEEAARIANLNPMQAAREIGKLSVKLSSVRNKKTTKAPDPVTNAGGGSVQISKDTASKSMDDIMADDSI